MEQIKKTDKIQMNKDNEKCIICGAETEYKFSTNIDIRKYYVEGAGQLCQKCFYDLFVKNKG